MVKPFLPKRQRPPVQRSLLYYDSQCGFCTRTARWLDRLDILGSLEFRASLDAEARRAGLTQDDLAQAVYLVTPAGAAYGGFYAVRQLARRLPLLWPLTPLVWIPGATFFGERNYHWVAQHRGAISRCIGTSCHLPDIRDTAATSNADPLTELQSPAGKQQRA